ncbi:NfrA family protein [Emcibacter sp.]|uniref:NfrA family protein n=1 Tax=Emcibacter sp. TaxID=1979954 RepID=UPI002AA67561|nr:tetratricopeptide repeat protein [Emcibacter sp.]
MSTRSKYFLLLLTSAGICILVFHLLWTSDLFQQERAWYQAYPYRGLDNHAGGAVTTVRTAIVTPPAAMITAPSSLAMKTDLDPEVGPTPIPNQQSAIPVSVPPTPIPPVLTVRFDLPQTIDEVRKSDSNWYPAAAQGYRLLADGDHRGAAEKFEQALKLNPDHTDLKLQLAYSYLKLHENDRAAKWFSAAIQDQDPDAPFALRRQLEEVNNRWSLDGYLIYRDQNDKAGPLTGPNLVQSQAGMEVAWQPPHIGYNNGRRLQLYGRLLWALEKESLRFSDTSYQGGLGIRLKPLSAHNFVLSAERLLEVGTFARNDWMVRAGYSLDHNTDWKPMKNWWSWSLYLDAALIRPQDPDIFLTFQGQGGYAVRLSEKLIIKPRGLVLASWQKDRFREAHLVEGGPGITAKYYFNQTRLEAWRSYLEVSADYRFRLAGNSLGKSGPVISLQFHF